MLNSRTLRTSAWMMGALLVASITQAEPTVETLQSVNDSHPIVLTYYPVKEKSAGSARENAPVVVLLNGSDHKGRILWDKAAPGRNEKANFVQSLNDDGYAVITVDLRKFGDSKQPGDITAMRPDDWEKMASGDLFAVKQFIFDKHQEKQFNMNKMAIIAAGPTAPVALNFAAADWTMPPHDDAPVDENKTPRGQDVRAVVLLSPEKSAGRLNANRALEVLKQPELGVAMLVMVGAQDSTDKGQAKKVFEVMEKAQRKGETRVYLKSVPLKDREMGLIGKLPDQVENTIREFLNKHVKDFPSTWRDRKNKVTG